MLLNSVLAILIYRYTHQKCICIGTPVANRDREEIEALIGFFVNTLVLKIDLTPEDTFLSLVKKVKKVCLQAYDLQEISYEKVIEAINPDRHSRQNP